MPHSVICSQVHSFSSLLQFFFLYSIIVLYFRSIWIYGWNLHVVSYNMGLLYICIEHFSGCDDVQHKTVSKKKKKKKISRKNYGFLVNQEKWLKIWWKYVTCFAYIYMGKGRDKVQMYAISFAMNFSFILSQTFSLCCVLPHGLFFLFAICS